MAWSARRIAEHLGCGHATVSRDVDAILTELSAHQTKDAEKIRARELETLAQAEAAVLKVLDRAEAEDFELVLKASDRIAKLQERRAKLLGLDAPERLDATMLAIANPSEAARLVREAFGEDGNGSGHPGDAPGAADADGGPVGGDAGEVPPGPPRE
jgi:hypothetical protein